MQSRQLDSPLAEPWGPPPPLTGPRSLCSLVGPQDLPRPGKCDSDAWPSAAERTEFPGLDAELWGPWPPRTRTQLHSLERGPPRAEWSPCVAFAGKRDVLPNDREVLSGL